MYIIFVFILSKPEFAEHFVIEGSRTCDVIDRKIDMFDAKDFDWHGSILSAALELEEVARAVQRGDRFRVDDVAAPDHRECFLKWNPADANHLVVI